MILLQAKGISKSFGERTLFEDLDITIPEGRKIALVARNGNGKTTLLRILAGKEVPDEGVVSVSPHTRTGFLEQNPAFPSEMTVLETLFHSDTPEMKAIRDYEEALEMQSSHAGGEASEKLQQAIDRMDASDGWDYEARVKDILTRLGIGPLNQKTGRLSGGQKKRLALARVLLEEPRLLIMDEPTNHLDIEMVEWLEQSLSTQKTTLLLVTHDRYFLDRVTNEILELEDNHLYSFRGGFFYFLEKRGEREQLRSETAAKAKKLYAKELEWMRSSPKARRIKSRDRIARAKQLGKEARQEKKEEKVQMDLGMSRLGKKILKLDRVTRKYDKQVILKDFTYQFNRREKVGIAGANGTGKTTLLNLITGEVKPDSGEVEKGQTIVFGYYKQEQPSFPQAKRILEVIRDIAEYLPAGNGKGYTAEQMLERFLFPRPIQHQVVDKLSGGELRRLYLLTVLMKNPNFLLLDEPTNDLDILTLNVLENYLMEFPGCLAVVTHDRYFLDKLVGHLLIFEGNGKVKNFPGNYTEYREKQRKSSQAGKKTGKPKKEKPERKKKKLSYKEKREMEQLEVTMENLESRKKELEEKLNAGKGGHEELQQWSEELQTILDELDDKELRWLELSEMESGNKS